MNYLSDFFAGAFLVNCLPHLICGLSGTPFPSPFAKPPGKGDSPPLVNFLWGAFNLVFGVALLSWHPVTPGLNPDCLVFVAGFLALGVQLSLHFGHVRKGRNAK
jgi:hypothetical protein